MTNRVPSWVPEGFLIFSVVFGPLAFGAVEPWSMAILEAALFGLLVSSFWTRQVDLRHFARWSLLPAALAVVLIAVAQQANPRPVSDPYTGAPFTVSAPATWHSLLLWSAYCALLGCAPQVLSSPEASRRFPWVLFSLGGFVSFEGILQRGMGNTAYYGLRQVRHGQPFGPYANYNHAASMLVMCLFVGAGLAAARFAKVRRIADLGTLSDFLAKQALMLFLLAVVLLGLFFTGSRGGAASLILAVGVVAMAATRFLGSGARKLVARAGFLGIGAGLATALYAHPAWIGKWFGTHNQSVVFRLSMYRSGHLMWRDFPLFGIGLGALEVAFRSYQEPVIQGIVEHIHSDWLELLVETGTIGFTVVAVGFIVFIWRLIRRWTDVDSLRERWLIAGAFGAIAAFVIHGLMDFSFHIPANAVLFLTIICWVDALGNPKAPARQAPAVRKAGFGPYVACGFGALLITQAARPVVAEFLTPPATGLEFAAQEAGLERAYRWDPRVDLLYRRGLVYLYMAEADSQNRGENLRRALEWSTRALAADPDNGVYQYLQGAVLWRLGRVRDAQDFLREAQLGPNHA